MSSENHAHFRLNRVRTTRPHVYDANEFPKYVVCFFITLPRLHDFEDIYKLFKKYFLSLRVIKMLHTKNGLEPSKHTFLFPYFDDTRIILTKFKMPIKCFKISMTKDVES